VDEAWSQWWIQGLIWRGGKSTKSPKNWLQNWQNYGDWAMSSLPPPGSATAWSRLRCGRQIVLVSLIKR